MIQHDEHLSSYANTVGIKNNMHAINLIKIYYF